MPSPRTAADRSPSAPVTVAVVGALGYGLIHLRTLRDLAREGRCALTAVVDPRPLEGEALELAAGAVHHRDLGDLLAGDLPDVVVVATPIPTHGPLATAALRAGCHVLLEKPPTASFAEYEGLLEVVRETGRACQVGFQANGSDAYGVIADARAAGEIGDLVGIGVEAAWVRPTSYYDRARWAGRRRLDGVDVVDGVVTNPLAHAVTVALRIAGADRAEDVAVVETELFHANDIEADDTSAVSIRTVPGQGPGQGPGQVPGQGHGQGHGQGPGRGPGQGEVPVPGSGGTPIVLGLTLCAAEQTEPRVLVHGTAGRITFRYKTDVVEVDGVAGRRTVQCSSTGLLANLLDHITDPSVELLSPLAQTGGFMRVLEAIRTAPDPAPIPAEYVEWRTDDVGRHAVVRDVEHWCTRAATELRTFSALGAPWARPS